jgi:transposase
MAAPTVRTFVVIASGTPGAATASESRALTRRGASVPALRARRAACRPRHRHRHRHRHQEFIRFLKQVARAYPEGELHLIMDNYATDKRPEAKAWLAANPRISVHFTPTSGSWLNLVEVWFGIIDRQAIRRGTFGSVRDLNAKIRTFIDSWNHDRAHPFVWTKTADQILKKADRPKTSETRH